jgi:hypothetical protein
MIDGEFGRVAASVSAPLCSAPGWIQKPVPLRGVGFGARSGLAIVSNSAMPFIPACLAGVALLRRLQAASRVLVLAIAVPTL